MSLRTWALAAVAVALSACTLTLPVTGQLQSTNEALVGTATGHMDGAGELDLTLATGARCTGRFVYITGRQGSGTLICTDGRTGKFTFVSTGQRGLGDGTLDGAPFTFTFG